MSHPVKSPKKLIEVALPLDAINAAAAREKSIRHGHPSTLHLWWARRPLAAARAVIFAQMVNDPSWKWELEHQGEAPPNNLKASWASSRKRLFGILEELVKWESTTNEDVLDKARTEIRRSWLETCEVNRDHPQAAELFNPEKLPAFHDPFAGGGALPLEAQRLGLEAYASDLNPVAVLINKAMIEIPPKFAGRTPVNPDAAKSDDLIEPQWRGARGLAEDVRYYGQWMRDEAHKRIGHLYPPLEITAEMATDRPDLKASIGHKLTVIAWMWARTVKSPNPAFRHIDVPLASTFLLSSREDKEVYVEPVVESDRYSFTVKTGAAPAEARNGTKLSRANFRCLLSGTPISPDYIKSEAQAGRMGVRMMAMVIEGPAGRLYVSPSAQMEAVAKQAVPTWRPEIAFFQRALGFRVGNYGMTKWSDLFTARQTLALCTLADLVGQACDKIKRDSPNTSDKRGLAAGGTGSDAYAEAVSVYLAFALSKVANIGSSLASWMSDRGAFRETFARQALPMVWDFVEANPFADAGGSLGTVLDKGVMAINTFPANLPGFACQADAATQTLSLGAVVSTDPPYYDNIGYADLSDFFYVWLRRALRPVFPELFATLEVPKDDELVATPARHGGKEKAEAFFLEGMTQSDAPAGTAGASGLPSNDLLRVQTS